MESKTEKMESKTENKIDMWAEIGKTAGEVYRGFKDKGTFSLVNAIEVSKSDSNVVLMALGWLAREGKIEIKKTRKAYEMKITN